MADIDGLMERARRWGIDPKLDAPIETVQMRGGRVLVELREYGHAVLVDIRMSDFGGRFPEVRLLGSKYLEDDRG